MPLPTAIDFGLVLPAAPKNRMTDLGLIPPDPGVTAVTSGAPFAVTYLAAGRYIRVPSPPPDPGDGGGGRPPRPGPGEREWVETSSSDGSTPVVVGIHEQLQVTLTCTCPPRAGAAVRGTLTLHRTSSPDITLELDAFLLAFGIQFAGAYSLQLGGSIVVPVTLENDSAQELRVELALAGEAAVRHLTTNIGPVVVAPTSGAMAKLPISAGADAMTGTYAMVLAYTITLPDGTRARDETPPVPVTATVNVEQPCDVVVTGDYPIAPGGVADVPAFVTNKTTLSMNARFTIASSSPDAKLTLSMTPQPVPPGERTRMLLPIAAAPHAFAGRYPVELQYFLTIEAQPEKLGNTLDPTFTITIGDAPSFGGSRTIGFALAGGGALGSFQVGVVRGLYALGIRPNIVVGTSVGSINGAKIAEGEGTRADGYVKGLAGLVEVWLAMQTERDMYMKEPALAELGEDIGDTLLERVYTSAGALHLFGVVGALFALIGGLITKAQVEQVLHLHGLNRLDPIGDRMRGRGAFSKPSLDLRELARSPIKLLVSTVGLGSGALHHVDNLGRMFDAGDLTKPIAQVDLYDAILASAAIPFFLSGRFLNGELHVDGGVREVVPIAATAAAGAAQIYAVLCGTPEGFEREDQHSDLIDVVLRSTSLLVDEIVRRSARPRAPLGWNFPVTVIAPEIVVHGSRQIDPGGIRINMSYGFMRAFDVVDPRLGPAARAFSVMRGRQIAQVRKEIWENELELNRLDGFPPNDDNHDLQLHQQMAALIRAIRAQKCQLRGLVEGRVRVAGVASIDSSEEWWTQWERHQPGFGIMGGVDGWTMSTPWDQINLRTVGIIEKEVPCPVGTPPSDLDQEKQFWIHKGASDPGGAYIQSDRGFEFLASENGSAKQFWRDIRTQGRPWHSGLSIPSLAGFRVLSPSLFRARSSADSVKYGPYQAVMRVQAVGSSGADGVVAVSRSTNLIGGWETPVIAIAGGQAISATGAPSMIHSDRGPAGSFELLVPQGNALVHYTRDAGSATSAWRRVAALPLPGDALVSANFVETSFLTGPSMNGTFKAVAHLRPSSGADYLCWLQLVAAGGSWAVETSRMTADGGLITGISGRPVVLQSDFGAGNLELLVPQGRKLVHYFLNSDRVSNPSQSWGSAGELAPPDAVLTASSVAAFCSQVRGDDGRGALEAIAVWSSGQTQFVGCYSFNGTWVGPDSVMPDGVAVGLVAPF